MAASGMVGVVEHRHQRWSLMSHESRKQTDAVDSPSEPWFSSEPPLMPEEPRGLRILASLAESPPTKKPGKQEGVGRDLLAALQAVAVACNWEPQEVAHLLGCSHPNPESWRDADFETLEQSRKIVEFLRKHAVGSDQRASRERLTLCVEALARTRGHLNNTWMVVAWVASDGSSPSPLRMVDGDRLGSARREMIRRLGSPFLRPGLSPAHITVVGVQQKDPRAASPFKTDRAAQAKADRDLRQLLSGD